MHAAFSPEIHQASGRSREAGGRGRCSESVKHPLFLYEPGEFLVSFLAAVGLKAEKLVIFVYPGFCLREWRQGRTGLRALQQAFVNGPQLPGRHQQTAPHPHPPGRRLSTLSGLMSLFSGIAVAGWREEAFFWPKNNTRVSAGTSLLHPLPSIVSRCTIPGLEVLPSQLGAGGVKPKRDQQCV